LLPVLVALVNAPPAGLLLQAMPVGSLLLETVLAKMQHLHQEGVSCLSRRQALTLNQQV
jgi:hypothetical protein